MVIGVTGGIGSGKSTFTVLLAEFGAKVIDADKVAHQIIEEEEVRNELICAFGEEIVDGQGKIKRSELGKMAFSSQEMVHVLNNIVHPPLFKELKRLINEAADILKKQVVVVDAALLFEWGELELFDIIVVVEAAQEIRQQRLMERSGLSAQQIQERMAAQMATSEKAARADIAVENNGDLEALKKQAVCLWGQWTGI
tara:strand:- start:371 stop:964 length:594 start_codon:yes stop_codon:yes gene_type:complete